MEVLSLYIPALVETDQIKLIAAKLAAVDTNIPFTILAFFPEYQMKSFRSATVWEMIAAFEAVKSTGLRNVRLGNTGVFAHRDEDYELLNKRVGARCY